MSPPNRPEQHNIASNDIGTPERRRNLRFPFSASIEVVETKSGAKVLGRTSDLGLGGCYVDAISPFPTGADAHVRITKGVEVFEAEVKVIYSQIGMGMGLAFVSAQPKQFRQFQRWIQEISGKSAPLEDSPEPVPAESTQTMKNVVVSELIMMLIQKKILTEVEGKELLRKLFK